MSDNSPFREFPSYIDNSPRKSRKWMILSAIGLFILLSLAGLYLLGANTNKGKSMGNTSPVAKNFPSPTQFPTSLPTTEPSVSASSPTPTGKKTPTPTPGSATDRSELKIAVLNGSGTAGAAKGVSSYLNGLGYAIKTIGNADNYTYKNITIRISKSKSAFLPLLKKDLESNPKTSTVSASIVETASADAEVIVGK